MLLLNEFCFDLFSWNFCLQSRQLTNPPSIRFDLFTFMFRCNLLSKSDVYLLKIGFLSPVIMAFIKY